MPLKKKPKTLLKCCLVVTVDTFLEEWICNEGANLDTQKYQAIPPNVYDLFVNMLILEYSQKIRTLKIDDLTKCLQLFLTNRLSLLNLKCLANHTNFIYEDNDMVLFENLFLQKLPYMSNLTSLSFQASGKRVYSLPICTDSMMKVIGSSCPNLKSLDVSNTNVSDSGISCLIPSADNQGCPSIAKLFLFECYASIEGVCNILLNLPSLNFIGFKETGLAILRCHKRLKIELNLKHLNNIGCASSSCLNMNQFLYCGNLSRIICRSAPHLEQMKVRVADRYLQDVELGPKVSSLYLLFRLENVSNTGDGLLSLLSSYGHQLTFLAIYCDVIEFKQIIRIGELCKNLVLLDIRCNYIECSPTDSFSSDSTVPVKFYNLEKLFLNVKTENPPLLWLEKILHSTVALRTFYFAFASCFITDSWLEQVLLSINAGSLQTFIIELPSHLRGSYKLNLTFNSVLSILRKFPNLRNLGNLAAWSVEKSQINFLNTKNVIKNWNLNIFSTSHVEYVQERAMEDH